MTPGEWDAIRLSLAVSGASMAALLPVGVGIAWLLARREFPGKAVFETVVALPLVLPPVVTGYALLRLLGARGLLGAQLRLVGIELPFTLAAAVIAAAAVSLPLVVQAARVALEGVDEKLEQAARTLGARPLRVFATVTLPLAWRGVAAAGLLGLARSLGEFGATVVFAGNIPGVTQTIPTAIYSLAESGVPEHEAAAFRLALVSTLLAFGAVLAVRRLARARP